MFRVRANGQIEVGSEANLDHETRTSHTVTLTADDNRGAANSTASITVTIYVTDLDEEPTIMVGGLSIIGMASVEYAEGRMDAVDTYTAAGPRADIATWTLEGDDAGAFTISGGVLEFMTPPDYEMPADADMDNTYMVTVKADDGTYMDMQDVTVMVTNMKETGTVTLSSMSPMVGTELTAMLDDPDKSVTMTGEGEGWQWSKSMTMDGEYMDIDGAAMMSYTPVADDDGYHLRATATTAGMVATVQDQPGTVSLSSMDPVVGVELTASLSDADGSVTEAWQWSKSMDMNSWTDITGATSMSYTPVAEDEGYYLRATLTYTDNHGPDVKTEMAMTTNKVVADADALLVARYDTNGTPGIQKDEVITAINDYLFGTGDDAPSKAEVIRLINLYLFGS